jgi:hypothetical protein
MRKNPLQVLPSAGLPLLGAKPAQAAVIANREFGLAYGSREFMRRVPLA